MKSRAKKLTLTILALGILPSSALADMIVQRKVNEKSVIIQGSDVLELRSGQWVQLASDGARGEVIRIKGDRALIAMVSTQAVQEGDRVLLASQEAGIVAPEASGAALPAPPRAEVTSALPSGTLEQRKEKTRVSMNFLVGGNYSVRQNNAFNSQNANRLTLLPEVGGTIQLSRKLGLDLSLGYVQHLFSEARFSTPLPGFPLNNSQVQIDRTLGYMQIATGVQFRPQETFSLGIAPYLAVPVFQSTDTRINGSSFNTTQTTNLGRSDWGTLLTLGLAIPAGKGTEFLLQGRYAHGFENAIQTRDVRALIGLSVGL